MTPKQLSAIERHGRNLLAIFPNATERDPVKLCKQLRRIETKANHHFAMLCSHEWYVRRYTDPLGGDTESPTFYKKIHKLLGPESERVWLNRDPRGYALKIDLREGETLHRDWGGYGIIAPEIGPKGE